MGKVVVSLGVALVINALVAVGAAVAALNVAPPPSAPANLVVASSALKPADLVAVRNELTSQASLSPIASRPEPVSIGATQTTATIEGVQPNFAQLASWQIEQGRFFTSQDESALARVAVVSQGVAPNVSVGDTIRIRDVPFTIVGVARHDGPADTVLVPLRTGQIRLFGANAVDGIVVQVGAQDQAGSVTGQVESLLRTRHNLRPGQPDDFSVSDLQPGASARNPVTRTSVLRVIEQFVCSAKNSCARLEVN